MSKHNAHGSHPEPPDERPDCPVWRRNPFTRSLSDAAPFTAGSPNMPLSVGIVMATPLDFRPGRATSPLPAPDCKTSLHLVRLATPFIIGTHEFRVPIGAA